MEIYHLVICCVFFRTVLCFRALDAIPEHAIDSLPLDANNQNCNCENGDCVTDKLGHSKCVCKPGFALQDEFSCKPCHCGSLGKCIFVLKVVSSVPNDQYQYEKKCVCDIGKAEKDGVCVDCDCGENSVCDFDYGEKRCYCIEGYSEKDGVCTKCDCGFNGECEFENGNKKCECDEGYLELNGVCEVGCNAQNPCQYGGFCKKGFCLCVNGTKGQFCEVIDGCSNLCPNQTGDVECSYDIFNQKAFCRCLDYNLSYDRKRKQCRIPVVCEKRGDCRNEGLCVRGFCRCRPGTRGARCETVDDCYFDRIECKGSDAYCAYDVRKQSGTCVCQNKNYYYNFLFGRCMRR